MPEVTIPIPKELEKESPYIEHRLREVVELEIKRRMLTKLFDELMKGARQLSDEELVALGRQAKKGRHVELKKKGLV